MNDPIKPTANASNRTDAEIEAECEEYWTPEAMRDAQPRPLERHGPEPEGHATDEAGEAEDGRD